MLPVTPRPYDWSGLCVSSGQRASLLSLPRVSGLKPHDSHDAGARREGGCLQSSFQRVRLPPASLLSKVPMSSGPAAPRSIHSDSDRCVPDMGYDNDDVTTDKVSSEGRAPDYESGSHGFDSRTTTQVENLTTGRESVHHEARGRRAYVGSAASWLPCRRVSKRSVYGSDRPVAA